MKKVEDTIKLMYSIMFDLENLFIDQKLHYQDKINDQKKTIDLLNEIIVEHCNGKKRKE